MEYDEFWSAEWSEADRSLYNYVIFHSVLIENKDYCKIKFVAEQVKKEPGEAGNIRA